MEIKEILEIQKEAKELAQRSTQEPDSISAQSVKNLCSALLNLHLKHDILEIKIEDYKRWLKNYFMKIKDLYACRMKDAKVALYYIEDIDCRKNHGCGHCVDYEYFKKVSRGKQKS